MHKDMDKILCLLHDVLSNIVIKLSHAHVNITNFSYCSICQWKILQGPKSCQS